MLVIFDCDGVLVDTEPIANRVFTELINEYGWAITLEETIRRFIGRSLPSCIAEIEEVIGKQLPKEFAEQYYARVYSAFAQEARAVEGVREVIEGLQVAYCVASSSGHKKLRYTLEVAGLLDLFDTNIFSSEDVAMGKPAPDLFLYAAHQMGYDRSDCVVIEDSVSGVLAAIAAQMAVFAYRGYADPAILNNYGATTFSHMSDLPGLLKTIC